MATVACEQMQLQKLREDLNKAIAETKAIKLDALAKLNAEHQKLKNTEARCATLEAYMHHETAKADRCWSRAEALEEANIALKKEVELLKRERSQLQLDLKCKYEREDSMRWSQLQEELKLKDELIIYAVETRQARKRSQVDLMAKLASKEEELKSTEARCAALEANLHQELTQARETWSRNLEALEKDNVALKEKVHLLKSAQSQLELAITKIEGRQAHSKQSNQSDSMAEVTSNKELQSTEVECEVTLETPEASQELAQSEHECGSEVELPQSEGGCTSEVELPQSEGGCRSEAELPQSERECSSEVELPQSEGGCTSEVELPQSEGGCTSEVELPQSKRECSSEVEQPEVEDKCSSEAELPQSEGGCSSEMQQLVILKNVKMEHETEESKHKSSNKKVKNNKQLHQKKKNEKKRRSRRPHSFY